MRYPLLFLSSCLGFIAGCGNTVEENTHKRWESGFYLTAPSQLMLGKGYATVYMGSGGVQVSAHDLDPRFNKFTWQTVGRVQNNGDGTYFKCSIERVVGEGARKNVDQSSFETLYSKKANSSPHFASGAQREQVQQFLIESFILKQNIPSALVGCTDKAIVIERNEGLTLSADSANFQFLPEFSEQFSQLVPSLGSPEEYAWSAAQLSFPKWVIFRDTFNQWIPAPRVQKYYLLLNWEASVGTQIFDNGSIKFHWQREDLNRNHIPQTEASIALFDRMKYGHIILARPVGMMGNSIQQGYASLKPESFNSNTGSVTVELGSLKGDKIFEFEILYSIDERLFSHRNIMQLDKDGRVTRIEQGILGISKPVKK